MLAQSFDAESARQRSLVQQIIDKLACIRWAGAWDILTGDLKAIICRVFWCMYETQGTPKLGIHWGGDSR
jgi:hypothetical protein